MLQLSDVAGSNGGSQQRGRRRLTARGLLGTSTCVAAWIRCGRNGGPELLQSDQLAIS